MMFLVHQIVGRLMNPVAVAVVAWLLALFLRRRRPRWAVVCAGGAVSLLLVCSLPIANWVLAGRLERDYPIRPAEAYPSAGAIVLLGGGVAAPPDGCDAVGVYPHLRDGANRAWFAAALWHAGRAPLVLPTGVGTDRSDGAFLRALGVPDAAVVIENEARNTEENARRTATLLAARGVTNALVVTSAIHMRRAMKMFRRYAPGLVVVPAPCDHVVLGGKDQRPWLKYVPDFGFLGFMNSLWHEYLGILRYSIL